MRIIRGIVRVGLTCICLLICSAVLAQQTPWADERLHLSMSGPQAWAAMDEALLFKANDSISHVTGRGFIAGYSAHGVDVLLFPYLLVQFKPYTDLPAEQQPTAKLDDRGKLELLLRITRAFEIDGALPDGIDIPAFIERYQGERGRLLAMDDDGRFDFAGRIPLEDDSGTIEYHTHGVLGLTGVAMVTVFDNERFDTLAPIIDGPMRTLAFDPGHGYDALPDEPAGVAGFRPPPIQPIPTDYLRVGKRAFAFPEPAEPGFYVLGRPTIGTQAPVAGSLPRGFENGAFELVLTRSPTSSSVTHPWIAAGFTRWADTPLGIDRLTNRLTDAQWAMLLSRIVNSDADEARREAARLRADASTTPRLRGRAGPGAGSGPARLESLDLDAGRLMISQRLPAEEAGSPERVRYTAVMLGADGAAVLVAQDYADGGVPIKTLLAGMADASRYEGGARYADVPPPPSDQPAAIDTPRPAEARPTPTEPSTQDRAADLADDSIRDNASALPIILGGLGVAAVVAIAIVVTVTHLNMKKKRHRAQARRERLAQAHAPAKHAR